MSFKRLSVDLYVKLEALREEDDSKDRMKFLKTLNKQREEEDNFFLDTEEGNNNKGFEDVTMGE